MTDLLHNKTVKDTVTEGFISAVEETVVPTLSSEYGASLEAVQMYEDFLGDGFTVDGVFHYPLTVKAGGELYRRWMAWDVSEPRDFADGIPYSYMGEAPLDIKLVDAPPVGLAERLEGRPMYFEGGCIDVRLQPDTTEKAFLSGRCSQSFVDELARQMTEHLSRAFSVTGFPDSGVSLIMAFSPNTYMEHIVENVTYRRLLIIARGCSARDFWIKWTNKRGTAPLTVSDVINDGDVRFELAEDVPQKIREKEYRFLVRTSADKYQAAMGRKNITEWRELIKRVIKRGELTHVTLPEEPVPDETGKLNELLIGVLGKGATDASTPIPEERDNSDLTALLAGIISGVGTKTAPETAEAEITETETAEAEITETEEAAETEAAEAAPILNYTAEAESVRETATEVPEYDELSEPELRASATEAVDVDALRRQIEAELREKLAEEARIKAEEEARALREENERLAEAARRAEEERLELERASREAAERHRLEMEARERAEAREKERIAEAARIAVMEEAKRAVMRAEEERLAAERSDRLRREAEEARAAEERRREAERIEAELRARAEAESAAQRAAQTAAQPQQKYTFVSKLVKLIFRSYVDPNVTKRIHELILSTIRYYHKESVPIHIKVSIPDENTVHLNFTQIPEEENDLLIKIIRVLGKSNLGIIKAFLE